MIDKKVLIILVLLAFHSFYIRGLGEQSEPLVQQARLTERKIQREKELADRAAMGEEKLAALEASIAFNRALLFPAEENVSTAMARLQQQLKEAGEKSGVKLTSLRSGEPEVSEGRPYARLPISFTVVGSPDEAGRFLVELFHMGRYLHIFTADLASGRDNKLHLSMSVAAYRFLPPLQTDREAI